MMEFPGIKIYKIRGSLGRDLWESREFSEIPGVHYIESTGNPGGKLKTIDIFHRFTFYRLLIFVIIEIERFAISIFL